MLVGVGRFDAAKTAYFQIGLPAMQRRATDYFPEQAFFRIETQLGFALVFVRSVALEAVLRQNRPDVAVELDRLAIFGDEAGDNRKAKRPPRSLLRTSEN